MYGKRTEKERKLLPNWIINGSDLVKREFISGFQGGDGREIRYVESRPGTSSYAYQLGETSQSTDPLYKDSLMAMMKQCVQILEYFGIEVNYLKERISNDTENRVIVSYKMSSNQENIIRYFKTIGYRYSKYKTTNSAKVVEYLMVKKRIVDQYTQLVDFFALKAKKQVARGSRDSALYAPLVASNLPQKIRRYYDLKKTGSEIAKILNLNKDFVRNKIAKYKKECKISVAFAASTPNLTKNGNNVVDWVSKFEDKAYSLFIPIEKIEEVKDQKFVSDITVESDNHSFVGGDGFLTKNCGIVKNLSLLTRVTSGRSPLFVEDVFDETKFSEMSFTEGTKVFLNGAWIFNIEDPTSLYRNLLLARRNSLYDPDYETSLVYDKQEGELRILSDSGRCIRPVYLVNDEAKVVLPEPLPDKFSDLVKNGFIEYIDPAEEDTTLIATDISMLSDKEIQYHNQFIHCELEPSSILGIASTIPFPANDQSPRITYQSSMSKQSCGVYSVKFREQDYTVAHVLYYPQKPLVSTVASRISKFDELPAGVNVIWHHREFHRIRIRKISVIVSKSAVDRGQFRSVCFRKVYLMPKSAPEV